MGIGKYEWGENRYTTVVKNGPPANRLNVAILGDGYCHHEMEMYRADAASVIQAFQDTEPMKSYIQHFNFHRVDVISKESGCKDAYQKPPVNPKTALGTHFSFINERRLVGHDWRVRQVAKRAGVPYDSLLVIVNTPRRGGATHFNLAVGYASRNSSDFPRIMIHEAGHSIAKLNDEYAGEIPDIKFLKGRSLPNLLPFANVTTNAKDPPWMAWIDPKTTLPTPFSRDTPKSLVGAFEGASYTNFGVYRPTVTCLMKRHSSEFCPVCSEQWIKRIYRQSTIADDFAPFDSLHAQVDEGVKFSAELVRPSAEIQTMWRVRLNGGTWDIQQNTTHYHPLNTSFPQSGRWQVECILEDRSAKVRKPDVIDQSRQSHRWTVTVR